MRMRSPLLDASCVAVGDATITVDDDGAFNVPDVHVDRLRELGWMPAEDQRVSAPLVAEGITATALVEIDGVGVARVPLELAPAVESDPLEKERRELYELAIAEGQSEDEARRIAYGESL